MAPVKRHPQKSAGHRARPITPEPVTVPVATRAWCVRDSRKLPNNSATSRLRRFKPAPRPKKFIAIRTKCAASTTASMPGFEGERWASAGQALVFGCAVIGRTADWRIDREVIFYPDDLPESGVVALRKYVQELTWRLGARPRKEGGPRTRLDLARRGQIGNKGQRTQHQGPTSAAIGIPQALLLRRLRRWFAHHWTRSSPRAHAPRFGLARD
jgi:hypothetical protein